MSIEFSGRVEAVLVTRTGKKTSQEVGKIQVFANKGVAGDSHYGSTRLSDVRERALKSVGLPKGLEIANARQFSGISKEDLITISEEMGLHYIPYGLLSENIVLSGIENFTQLPIGTMLLFRKSLTEVRSAVLCVSGENLPCEVPAQNIRNHFRGKEPLVGFQKAAYKKRGVVGTVHSSGFIATNDKVAVVLPK